MVDFLPSHGGFSMAFRTAHMRGRHADRRPRTGQPVTPSGPHSFWLCNRPGLPTDAPGDRHSNEPALDQRISCCPISAVRRSFRVSAGDGIRQEKFQKLAILQRCLAAQQVSSPQPGPMPFHVLPRVFALTRGRSSAPVEPLLPRPPLISSLLHGRFLSTPTG